MTNPAFPNQIWQNNLENQQKMDKLIIQPKNHFTNVLVCLLEIFVFRPMQLRQLHKDLSEII